MDLLRAKQGSCRESCVTSSDGGNEITGIKVEKVTDIAEEDNQESLMPEVVKMEPDVSIFLVLCTFNDYPAFLEVYIHETVSLFRMISEHSLW
jgi:hypothetical protein